MIGEGYLDGASPLHRLPAGPKLLGLLVVGTVLFAAPDIWLAALALGTALAGGFVSGLPVRTWARVLRASAPLLVLIVAIQAWTAGWDVAALFGLRFAALLLLATLLTLTTPTSALIAALECGFAWLAWTGLDPARASLAVALVLRFIPVIAQVAAEVREAQRARGIERDLLGLVMPVLVRTLRMADEIAEAIDARS